LKLAEVLAEPEYAGIRRIVEDLYPDRAHFLYELLQNAEDVGARKASFSVRSDALVFEHSGGSVFNDQNIAAITNIGWASKETDEDTIGRFGVGFKAVFAYCETPHIYSGTYAFRITDLVVPEEVPSLPDLGTATRFVFPFNNPKKPPESAAAEILEGLEGLSSTTLLFLRHIAEIVWEDGRDGRHAIRRVEHPGCHIEIRSEATSGASTSRHYLRFAAPVATLPKQNVAIAFALTPLDTQPTSAVERTGDAFAIAPESGCVSVYFPAEKETSNLRFHLHAPFVPELSRASVKETTANDPLFAQLADLAAGSLPAIRDAGLLTREFLAVLPNANDQLPARYRPIREAIIAAMREESLTPTVAGNFAPARRLLQGSAAVKDLLDSDDLAILVSGEPPLGWAVAATQRNSDVDRFLASLAMQQFDVNELAERLAWATGLIRDVNVEKWLASKTEAWHQLLYSVLSRDPRVAHRWPSSRIVRLTDGTYAVPAAAYYPESDGSGVGPRVARAVYESGRQSDEQVQARKFLDAIGVHTMGEAEAIERILADRYASPADIDSEAHLADIRRFVAFVASGGSIDGRRYAFFRDASARWARPCDLYLDLPYAETLLGAWFTGDAPAKQRLASIYTDGLEPDAFRRFAEHVGVQVRLETKNVGCYANPQWSYLASVRGERYRAPINEDYIIEGLAERLDVPNVELSRLVWRTMRALPSAQLEARYQKAERWGMNRAPSQLVHVLQTKRWVAQTNGSYVTPAEASRTLLPSGFAFDEGDIWLQRVSFGANETAERHSREEEHAWAVRLGFPDYEHLDRARRFTALPAAVQQEVLFDLERRHSLELPSQTSSDPERRAERVGTKASDAPERETRIADRSVAVGFDEVKNAADAYLIGQYTNSDGVMICQMCKAELPFRRTNGSYYFESVEFLANLRRRHHQNYLALCPNHAAMFMYANATRATLPVWAIT
jgi:hypothetical protein